VIRFEEENEARATISQIIGGMAMVLTFAGLVLTEKDSQEKSRLDQE
jgi:glucose uptake protein GlcU